MQCEVIILSPLFEFFVSKKLKKKKRKKLEKREKAEVFSHKRNSLFE